MKNTQSNFEITPDELIFWERPIFNQERKNKTTETKKLIKDGKQ